MGSTTEPPLIRKTPEEADEQYGQVIWENEKWRLRQRTIASMVVIVAHRKSDDGKCEELPRGYLLGSNILQLEMRDWGNQGSKK